MAINITADPIVLTTSQEGSFVEGVIINADPIENSITIWGIFSSYPPAARNPDLDQIFYCNYTDVHGNKDAGIPEIEISIQGTWLNVNIVADPIVITISQEGTYPSNIFVSSDPIEISLSIATSAEDFYTENIKSNWIKWSNIGQMDFTIGRDNIAGERPLDWKGWIYAIKKMGGRAIVYGKNGISALIPSGNAWGLQTIYRIGLKGKNAIAGDESIHFFIDNKDQLFSLSESLQKLDYSEYLSVLTNPVLSYDLETGLLYICDGTYGFVYNYANKSLGKGPVNITGISSQNGTLYAVSPTTITTPPLEICTDIYDMGTRFGKTIYSLEIGTDLDGILQAAIDYRLDKAATFTQTGWFTVDKRGVVYITAYGREFRFRIRNLKWEYFEIDHIIINGEVHRY